MATAKEESSLLRILISTDNHLGVWEKDEVRKDDSFTTFEEVFKVAAEMSVDFVLLGGDLFHDSKPSQQCLIRTMGILRKYCLNDNPIRLQILSDQADNFASGLVNFESPNHNIGLPVFTIHGNHDDPSGPGNVSAVDILSEASFVNYFGKVALGGSGVGKIRLAPILLQKGGTKVALYGLGNVRDERLGRMFLTPGSVEWARPADDPEYPADDWFSIFTLHQNRVVHTQSAKNCVKDTYLPNFLDFVVWGHEHECIPEPVETAHGMTILQPGSSVATALSEGEAKKKHIFVLEVLKGSFRTIKQELLTVRPFKFEQVVLADQLDLDLEDAEAVGVFLEGKVQAMVNEAMRRQASGAAAAEKRLPLVRLRVDYTGCTTINSQRFGQKFVGKVANPHDVLHWHKAAAKRQKPETDDAAAAAAKEPADEAQIADLISEHLTQTLSIIPEVDLAHALRDFVEKDEKQALSVAFKKAMQAAQNGASSTQLTGNDDDVAAYLQKFSRQKADSLAAASRLPRAERSTATGSMLPLLPPAPVAVAEADEDGNAHAGPTTSRAASARGRSRGRGASQQTIGEVVARGRKRATLDTTLTPQRGTAVGTQRSAIDKRAASLPRPRSARKASAKAKRALAATAEVEDDDESDADVDMDQDLDEVEDSDDDMDVEEPPPKKRRGPAKLAVNQAGRSRAASPAAPAPVPVVLDSDDDEEVQPSARGVRKLPGSLFGSNTGASQPIRSQGGPRAWGSARR